MANEKRLIDANALKAHINGVSTHWLNDWSTIGVLATIDKQPTVDAVPVVRCKDCKHWTMGYCNHFAYYSYEPITSEDDFCSYGERREGE